MVDAGRARSAHELGLLFAAEYLVVEVNARMDANNMERALDLYADDAVVENARGREEIRQLMIRMAAAGAGVRACHVLANLRADIEGDTVVVRTTQVAYLLDSPRPYRANTVLNVNYVLQAAADGNLRIIKSRVVDKPDIVGG